MTTKEDKNLIIEGRLFWASVHTPNSHSGKYQVDISIDETTTSLLSALGVPIKKEEDHIDSNGVKGKYVGTENDRKTYVTAKRSLEAKDGTPLKKATIVDAKTQSVGAETALGNGTRANVKVNPFEWKFKGKKGVSLGFSVIQVLDLVEFKQNGLDGFEITEGYTGKTTTTLTSADDEDPFAMAG